MSILSKQMTMTMLYLLLSCEAFSNLMLGDPMKYDVGSLGATIMVLLLINYWMRDNAVQKP